MDYRVKANFGYFKEVKAGEIHDFNKAQAQRFSHLLEPVNSVSDKNKMFKKGRRKAK